MKLPNIKKLFKRKAKRADPVKYISYAFLTGAMFNNFVFMLLQDWQGKEAYLAKIQNNWLHMHWGWSLGLMIITIVIYLRITWSFAKLTTWMRLIKPPGDD